MAIELTQKRKCKCPCNSYVGSDGINYWVDLRKKEVYYTDCHKANPKKVISTTFLINGKLLQT